jgi:hypothetical protein
MTRRPIQPTRQTTKVEKKSGRQRESAATKGRGTPVAAKQKRSAPCVSRKMTSAVLSSPSIRIAAFAMQRSRVPHDGYSEERAKWRDDGEELDAARWRRTCRGVLACRLVIDGIFDGFAPGRKMGIDAVNGSLRLSLTRCCAATCQTLTKITSVRTKIFRLTSGTPYKVHSAACEGRGPHQPIPRGTSRATVRSDLP